MRLFLSRSVASWQAMTSSLGLTCEELESELRRPVAAGEVCGRRSGRVVRGSCWRGIMSESRCREVRRAYEVTDEVCCDDGIAQLDEGVSWGGVRGCAE